VTLLPSGEKEEKKFRGRKELKKINEWNVEEYVVSARLSNHR
jgi:hypothetical protein